jgi:hypothetical protein
MELVTRSEARPRAEPVAARGRAGSSIFILGGVPPACNYSQEINGQKTKPHLTEAGLLFY